MNQIAHNMNKPIGNIDLIFGTNIDLIFGVCKTNEMPTEKFLIYRSKIEKKM